jgi:hypothetical protein
LLRRTTFGVWQRISNVHTAVQASTTRTISNSNEPPETGHTCKNRSVLDPDILCITLPPRKYSPNNLALQGSLLNTTKTKVVVKPPVITTQAEAKPTVSDQGTQAASSSPATRSLPQRASQETGMAWSHKSAEAEADWIPADPRWRSVCARVAPMAAQPVQLGPALA